MTDPAAAETLVSLGRQERVGSGGSAGEDMDDEGEDAPRRKRTRKSRTELSENRRGRTRRSGRLGGDEDDGEDEDEDGDAGTAKAGSSEDVVIPVDELSDGDMLDEDAQPRQKVEIDNKVSVILMSYWLLNLPSLRLLSSGYEKLSNCRLRCLGQRH